MRGVVLKTGDAVIIEERVPATVKVASENGRSLILTFEAILDIKGTDLLAVGSLVLSMIEDGRYVELMTGAVIELSRPT